MESRTVYVTGFSKGTRKEQLAIYFQSKKKSGGGDIETDIRIEDGEAVVVFDKEQGADGNLNASSVFLS